MTRTHTPSLLLLPLALIVGCASPKVDFAKIQRPARAAELDAFSVFVGNWNWEADVVSPAEEQDKHWTGSAQWDWTLDQTALHGRLSAKCARAEFESEGLWGRNPKTRKYEWSMFNNWGYPQDGTAHYDAASKTWTMSYNSIGLDGTASRGMYEMRVVDDNTLDWHLHEKDSMGMVTKLEMKGTYRRKA